mmetsp:Transcript_41484/g.47850  ORF Transcript_41484/g.47850 Transcript_41484/m.47850 type:complete len:279 (-) Transcript_41484:50-886(-)
MGHDCKRSVRRVSRRCSPSAHRPAVRHRQGQDAERLDAQNEAMSQVDYVSRGPCCVLQRHIVTAFRDSSLNFNSIRSKRVCKNISQEMVRIKIGLSHKFSVYLLRRICRSHEHRRFVSSRAHQDCHAGANKQSRLKGRVHRILRRADQNLQPARPARRVPRVADHDTEGLHLVRGLVWLLRVAQRGQLLQGRTAEHPLADVARSRRRRGLLAVDVPDRRLQDKAAGRLVRGAEVQRHRRCLQENLPRRGRCRVLERHRSLNDENSHLFRNDIRSFRAY